MNKMTEYEFYRRVMKEKRWNGNALLCPGWISPSNCPVEALKPTFPRDQRDCNDVFKHIYDKYNISDKLSLI